MRTDLSTRSLWSRLGSAVAIILSTVTVGVAIAPAVVGADAADVATAVGSAVVNPDGSITVTVSGTWVWTTHDSDCNLDRFGTGWAVDWNDANQPGNPLGSTGVDVGSLVLNSYNPADNTVHYSAVAPYCGTYSSSAGYNSGNWGPISHTYAPGTTSITACAVTYDIHKADHSDGPDPDHLIAGGDNRQTDNSVEKNGKTPAGNVCKTVVLPARITLNKVVTNNNGGAATIADFALRAAPSATPNDYVINAVDPSTSSATGATATVDAGSYVLSEGGPAGYAASAWTCIGGNLVGATLTVGQGGQASCTITNDDVAPTVKLVKTVVNNNGGRALPGDFQLRLNSDNAAQNTLIPLTAGHAYTVSEVAVAGYSATNTTCVSSIQGSANNSNVNNVGTAAVTLAAGESVVCTITNDDVAPRVKLVKVVVNDDNGSATSSQFNLTIDGVVTGQGVFQAVTAGVTHSVSEQSFAGYMPTGAVCTSSKGLNSSVVNSSAISITPVLGEDITCTISNTDVRPGLTVVKNVVNDNGGNATVSSFPLFVNNNPVVSNAAITYPAGTLLSVRETQSAGYSATNTTCVSSIQGSANNSNVNNVGTAAVTLAAGEFVVCTITNDDKPVDLQLTKDDGGITAVAGGASFPYTITVSNIGTRDVDASEPAIVTDVLPAGFQFDGTPTSTTATCAVPVGNTATCTIAPADLQVGESVVITASVKALPDTPKGTYTNKAFVTTTDDPACVGSNCVPACPGVLRASSVASSANNVDCEDTPVGKPATVSVSKTVAGVASGYAWSFDFRLSPLPGGQSNPKAIAGTGPGAGTNVVTWGDLTPGVTYTISEDALAGWTQALTCANVSDLDQSAASVTFVAAIDQTLSCSAVNTAAPASIEVVKTSVDGTGTFTFAVTPADVTGLSANTATANPASSGVVSGLVPGRQYSVSEIDPGVSWTVGTMTCTIDPIGVAAAAVVGATFTPKPGDAVSCAITNTKKPVEPVKGVIVVDKVTVPNSDTTTLFDFTITGGPNFSLTNPAVVHNSGLLAPGTYTVTELDEPGWVRTDLNCVNSLGSSVTTNLGNGTAVVTLVAGDIVTCTYTSRQLGQVTVDKTVTAGPTRVAGNTHTVAYNLIVTSHSYVAETFDLVDALHFGAGTTVTSAVAGGPSGVTLVPGWNGTSATLLADDQTISARTEAAASTLAFTVTVTFTVSPTITAEARNCALTGNETATGTLNSATVTVRNVSDDATACGDIPSPQADLAIVKTASTANPQLGSSPSFSYTLTVTNAGPDVAQNVVVTDSVPATLTVTGVTTPDFTCVTSGNELSCTRPSLVVGGVAVITVAVVLKADVVSEVQIINSAFVSADTPDPNLSNNSHVAAVTPTGDQESAPPQPPTPDPTLPSTGGDARYLVEVAFGLLAAGLFVAQLARRRRRHLLS